jgi:hypothetical protein
MTDLGKSGAKVTGTEGSEVHPDPAEVQRPTGQQKEPAGGVGTTGDSSPPASNEDAKGGDSGSVDEAKVRVSTGDTSVDIAARSTEVRVESSGGNCQPVPRATLKQKIWLSIYLAIVTILAVMFAFIELQALNEAANREVQVSWVQPDTVWLRSGPPAFRYDQAKGFLMYQGQIDQETKNTLLSLAEPRNASYERAIEYLAYEARRTAGSLVILVLVLGGIGGVIGVHIRSTSNFLGVACYKNILDVNRWWPWYALRPVLAFLIGVLVVVLVKSDLVFSGQKADSGGLGWLGLAALAGFGVEDVMVRLRDVSKTLFAANKADTTTTVKAGGGEPETGDGPENAKNGDRPVGAKTEKRKST